MDVDAPGSSGRAAAEPSAADEPLPVSPVAADERKRPAQSSGALGVRKHGKAGKRGALSHKQKRRKAQALEKVRTRASLEHLFRKRACCESVAHAAGAGDGRPAREQGRQEQPAHAAQEGDKGVVGH